jgi:hypothetical protein
MGNEIAGRSVERAVILNTFGVVAGQDQVSVTAIDSAAVAHERVMDFFTIRRSILTHCCSFG